jgi:hypothetical protein
MQNTKNPQTTKWLFLAVHKDRIIKDNEGYLIFKVREDDYSVIISNKFRRKKEGEFHLYFSIPENFVAKARLTAYNKELKRYDVVEEKTLTAWQLVKMVNEDNKFLPHEPTAEEKDEIADDKLPF